MDSRFDTLFLNAREFASAEERSAFLDKVCAGDPNLRTRLEAKLILEAEAAEFFGEAVTHIDVVTQAGPPGESPGTFIGPFKLLEQIGEGGFGTVWMAEQLAPVRRRVALKIIKLGFDTKEVIARFEQERQALATLDHPNIAKVHDAGATATGRPYFVMELVTGLPITRYCEEHQLPSKARLELFMDVCSAIQHAHQKGIIHRDIKPSNVLVSNKGDKPMVKVIDFGIAKATEQSLAGGTDLTQLHEFIGTPAYMSPEQASPGRVDIDTRSDVYSLGVLLYQLLTSRAPLESKDLMEAGLDEMRRVIREVDPPRPSTRIKSLLDSERTSVARAHQIAPGKMESSLQGDLDWIVMKALEKDRTRRYDTASSLAMDLRRHLDGDPVLAAPPGALYRLRKFARRHRAGLTLTTTIVVLLAAAAVVSAFLAVRATRAERDAESRRAEAEDVSTFFVDVLKSPDPARDGRTVTVAETLERASKRIDTALASQPERQAKFRAVLGNTWNALGLPAIAIPLQEKARDYWQNTFGLENRETLSVMQQLAHSYHNVSRGPEALALCENVFDLRRKMLGPEHPDTLFAMSTLAETYYTADRREEALALREQVYELRRKVLGPEHPETLLALNNLSISRFEAGDRGGARRMREELLETSRRVLGPEDPGTLRALQNLSNSYFDIGRRDEALLMRKMLVELRTKVFGPDHSDTLGAMAEVVNSLLTAGRAEEAVTLSQKVLEGCLRSLGPRHRYTIKSKANLAESLSAAGQREQALQIRQEVYDVTLDILGPEKLPTLKAANVLASSLAAAGRSEEALTLRDTTLTTRLKVYPPDYPDTIHAKEDFAESLFTAHRRAEALKLREEVLKSRREHFPRGHPDTLRAMLHLAESLDETGDRTKADALRLEAVGALPAPASVEADSLSVLFERARRHVIGKRWREAVADLSRADELQPGGEYLLPLAAVLVEIGGPATFVSTAQRALTRFAATKDTDAAASTARLCCLSPQAGVDLAAARQLAETARAGSAGNDARLQWCDLTIAWIEYRSGNFAAAIAGLATTSALPGEGKATAAALLAAAHHRLGHAAEAQAALQQAASLTASALPDIHTGSWPDWLVARIALREATALIKPDSIR